MIPSFGSTVRRSGLCSVMFMFVLLVGTRAAWAQTYTTNFPGTENPLSEGGAWTTQTGGNGVGGTAVQKVNGIAFCTQTGNGGFNDSTARLSGFGPDVRSSATVHIVPNPTYHECELLFRCAESGHGWRGYEVMIGTSDKFIGGPVNSPNGDAQIWRIEGGSFTGLASIRLGHPINQGDLWSATCIGNVITAFYNGVQVMQVTDSTYADGNPGIGFSGGSGDSGIEGHNSDFGYSSFTATGLPRPGTATILQASPSNPSAVAGQSIALTYNWQGGPTSSAETVFVHFVDGTGAILFGADHVPSPPTTSWSGTTSYTRAITLPSGLAPGSYPIMAGLYDKTSGARMSLTAGPGVTADNQLRYHIATLTVPGTPPPPPPPGATTLGITSVEPIQDSGDANQVIATSATLGSAGTVQSISLYIASSGVVGNGLLAIYDAQGGGGSPGTLLAQTASFALASGWYTHPVMTPVNLQAGSYYLAFMLSSNSAGPVYTTGTSNSNYFRQESSFALPNTFGSGISQPGIAYSEYATLATSSSSTFVLTNANSGLALDVQYSGTTAGTPVWQWTPNGTGAQNWQFTPAGDGYYYLTNPHSGMDLNVPGASTSPGVQLIIWPHTPGATNAEWKITPTGDGSFYLTNRNSSQDMDVRGAGTTAGTPVQQWPANGTRAQKWNIPGFAP